VEAMQLKEVDCCVHGVVLCPSLHQDHHAKLMSSGSHSAMAELNNAPSIPPDNYYNFSMTLRLLQPPYALLCTHRKFPISLQVGSHLQCCLRGSSQT